MCKRCKVENMCWVLEESFPCESLFKDSLSSNCDATWKVYYHGLSKRRRARLHIVQNKMKRYIFDYNEEPI